MKKLNFKIISLSMPKDKQVVAPTFMFFMVKSICFFVSFVCFVVKRILCTFVVKVPAQPVKFNKSISLKELRYINPIHRGAI